MKPHFTAIATLLAIGLLLASPSTADAQYWDGITVTWYGDCDDKSWKNCKNWFDNVSCSAGGTCPADTDDVVIHADNDDNSPAQCDYDVTGTGPDLSSITVTANASKDAVFKVNSSGSAVAFSTDTLTFNGFDSSNIAKLVYNKDLMTVDTSTQVNKNVEWNVPNCKLFSPNDVTIGKSSHQSGEWGDLKLTDSGDVRPKTVTIHGGSEVGEESYIRGQGSILVTTG